MAAQAPGLGEWLLVVDAGVNPEVEQEWNRWYDEVHLPEIIDCPGFLGSARYVSEDGEGRRYLTVYEVEGPEVLSSDEFQRRRGWRQFSEHVRFSTRIYRRLTTRIESAKGRSDA